VTLAPHTERVRHEAKVLRSQGNSIRVIAAELGVPRATVGGWLRGTTAQPSYSRVCFICGRSFTAKRSHARSCGRHGGWSWKEAIERLERDA
jgi:transcriptional regulator with XRE-family HTH domain